MKKGFIHTLALLPLCLTGCGAWQATKDTSSDVSRGLFVAKVKEMNLTIEGRADLNRDERGTPLPVALRVYQLEDAKAFERASYTQLLDDTGTVLQADALNRSDVVLAPDTTATLTMPMDTGARYVGVVGFFRDPAHNGWRAVIPRSQWRKTDPVRLSVSGSTMVWEQ